MNIGIRNRLYLMITREDAALDMGQRRFCFRWFSAEDGTTWSPFFHTFIRTWKY